MLLWQRLCKHLSQKFLNWNSENSVPNRLKVLMLAQYFPPDMGGASTRVSNVVKGLMGKGCSITVVAAFPHYPQGDVPRHYRGKPLIREKVDNVDVLRVWVPALPHNTIVNRVLIHLCFVVSSLFALPFAGKADVIWAANPNLFCFYSALAYGFVKRKPVVRNVDDLWPEVFYEMGIVQSKFMRVLLDFLAKLSYVVPAAITPVSAGYKRRIVEKYGIDPNKVHVIEVGVDSVRPLISRNEKKSKFVVMYSGVLGAGYDFEIVLKAANSLMEYRDIIFVIRGVGDLASRLRSLVKELNLRNVMLDTRLLSREKLSTLLQSADVFVLPMAPSNFVDEGLPAKLFEYQSYGKPIICISNGEPAKYVENTECGLCVKPGDAVGFADAVVKLYEDRKVLAQLARNGWQHVSKNLTADRTGKRIYDVLATA